MFDLSTLLLFVSVCIIAGLTPGPGLVYIVARSLQGGASYGVLSALGVFVGTFVHITAATLGLSALIMNSVIAFSVLKYLGAAYLIYLGIRALLKRDNDGVIPQVQSLSKRAVFLQGIITDILNPKTALFFLAFIPQFVNPDAGSVALQFLVYGMLANTVFTLIEIIIVFLAVKLGSAFSGQIRWRSGRKAMSGVTLIVLGVFVVFSDVKNK